MKDTKEQLTCPACQHQMTKIMTKEGVLIDICLDGCGGIWFDNRELAKFDEEHENAQEILEVIKGKTFKKVDTSMVRKCPVCSQKMVKNKYSMNTNVEIDECYNCGGKFLDNDELVLIRKSKQPTAEQVDNLVSGLYRTNNYKPYSGGRNGMVQLFNNLYNSYYS